MRLGLRGGGGEVVDAPPSPPSSPSCTPPPPMLPHISSSSPPAYPASCIRAHSLGPEVARRHPDAANHTRGLPVVETAQESKARGRQWRAPRGTS